MWGTVFIIWEEACPVAPPKFDNVEARRPSTSTFKQLCISHSRAEIGRFWIKIFEFENPGPILSHFLVLEPGMGGCFRDTIEICIPGYGIDRNWKPRDNRDPDKNLRYVKNWPFLLKSSN